MSIMLIRLVYESVHSVLPIIVQQALVSSSKGLLAGEARSSGS